jgi:ABC-type multidrug transport system ATPase subunit
MRSADGISADEPLLEVQDLAVSFERWGQRVVALRGVSFTVPRGQWVILAGPNGSGKSTLLRAIAGEIPSDSGLVHVGGKALDGRNWSRATSVYLVRQDPNAGSVSSLSPHENLLVAEERRAPRRELQNDHNRLLQRIGLEDRRRQPAGTLSAGQRQALALLIAQLRSAPLLLLDEPFASLDPENERLAMTLVRELHASGKTILQVSHDPSVVDGLGDRLLRLVGGVVAEDSLRRRSSTGVTPPVWRGEDLPRY